MRILIIEDDAAIAANLYDFLENAGYEPDLARDGAQGLHLAVTQRWDAILLDLSLPAVDGLTICRKLRKEVLLDAPILILTASVKRNLKLIQLRTQTQNKFDTPAHKVFS